MPRTTEIQTALTVIVRRVVGAEPDRVVPSARLREDLGIDSLSILEVSDALAQRFGTYLPDDVINRVETVDQLVNAIATGGSKPPRAAPSPQTAQSPRAAPSWSDSQLRIEDESAESESAGADTVRVADVELAKTKAKRWVATLALVGVAIGLIIGIGIIGLVRATGINDVTMAPAPSATDTAPASSESPTNTQSPSASETTKAPKKKKKPKLKADNDHVAPGDSIELTGKLPKLDSDVTLQVQTKVSGEDWEDFPVNIQTEDKGKFSTTIRTERDGTYKIRLIDKDGDNPTPSVKVTVG